MATLQGEGDGDPLARQHSHRTTRALEPAQFRGNLVVALRDVWKREVARGAGGRHADRDTPNRHANARKRGSSLVNDGTDHHCRGLCGRGSGKAEDHRRGSQHKFHGSMRDVYPCMEQNRVVSQTPHRE